MNPTPVYGFLQPLDVLMLRGNQLFGAPGSYGQALMPPWPSVAAGALRSHLLATAGTDWLAYASSQQPHPLLGTPAQPGPFALVDFQLARRDGSGNVEALLPLPADLAVKEQERDQPPTITVTALRPTPAPSGLESSAALPHWPVLPEAERSKASTGWWLTQAGWSQYLQGQCPEVKHLVPTSALWKTEERIGLGLDPHKRSAAEGQLFSSQAICMAQRAHGSEFDLGFLVGVGGLAASDLPARATLRFGGDGRAAAFERLDSYQPPASPSAAIARAGRCRLVLTAPGLFPAGWLPPGVGANGRIAWGGLRARLRSASVPRYEVVSGWDLALQRPKAAARAAARASVYWLDELEASAAALDQLIAHGLWPEPLPGHAADLSRRAEGYNRLALALD